nr:Chain B, Peptide [synthetic construct]
AEEEIYGEFEAKK